MLKEHRAANLQEMNRQREINDIRARENADQGDKTKNLEMSLMRTNGKIDDFTKVVDQKSYEIDATHKEIDRLRDTNATRQALNIGI